VFDKSVKFLIPFRGIVITDPVTVILFFFVFFFFFYVFFFFFFFFGGGYIFFFFFFFLFLFFFNLFFFFVFLSTEICFFFFCFVVFYFNFHCYYPPPHLEVVVAGRLPSRRLDPSKSHAAGIGYARIQPRQVQTTARGSTGGRQASSPSTG